MAMRAIKVLILTNDIVIHKIIVRNFDSFTYERVGLGNIWYLTGQVLNIKKLLTDGMGNIKILLTGQMGRKSSKKSRIMHRFFHEICFSNILMNRIKWCGFYVCINI